MAYEVTAEQRKRLLRLAPPVDFGEWAFTTYGSKRNSRLSMTIEFKSGARELDSRAKWAAGQAALQAGCAYWADELAELPDDQVTIELQRTADEWERIEPRLRRR